MLITNQFLFSSLHNNLMITVTMIINLTINDIKSNKFQQLIPQIMQDRLLDQQSSSYLTQEKDFFLQDDQYLLNKSFDQGFDTWTSSKQQEQNGISNGLKQKQSSSHYQALCATLLLIIGIIISIILYTSSHSFQLIFAISSASYVTYILAGCINNTLLQYFSQMLEASKFNAFYTEMKFLPGFFIFGARCYHTQIIKKTRTYTDQDGNTQTRQYTQEIQVETHRAKLKVIPNQTIDQSKEINQLEVGDKIIFVRFVMSNRFYDEKSKMNLKKLYDSFKSKNTKDQKQEFGLKYKFTGFIERKTFYNGSLNCSYQFWFSLFTIFGLIWPYSLWLQSKISRFEVKVKRAIKI